MHQQRDLASRELWQRELERSRRRRALAPVARKELARKRRLSAAIVSAVLAGHAAPAAAGGRSATSGPGEERGGRQIVELRDGSLPLARGSVGDLVAEVQRKLGVAADGIFGPQTERAVRAFQARAGLASDGIVGPLTWSALFGANTVASLPSGSERAGLVAVARTAVRVARASAVARVERRLERRARKLGVDRGRTSGGAFWAPAADNPADNTAAPPSSPAPAPGGGVCGTTTRPVSGVVTSNFGERRPGHRHSGIDIAAPTGTPVRAFDCGTVSVAGAQSGYGNIVCIRHSGSFSTCYAHLSRFAVRAGQRVASGQVIGYVGCTGTCTGPHLHFETRVGGHPVDPRQRLVAAGTARTRAQVASRSAQAVTRTRTAATERAQRGAIAAASTTARWSQPPATEREAPNGGAGAASTQAVGDAPATVDPSATGSGGANAPTSTSTASSRNAGTSVPASSAAAPRTQGAQQTSPAPQAEEHNGATSVIRPPAAVASQQSESMDVADSSAAGSVDADAADGASGTAGDAGSTASSVSGSAASAAN